MRPTPGNDLILGKLPGRADSLGLSRTERDKHLYVCGGTGTGKSKFLENLIRQDIRNWSKSKCGVLLLDPHGNLYDNLINWLAWRNGHNFPFCGIFRCTCGAMMTAQWAKGHGGLYRYYRCSRKIAVECREPYLQEKSVAAQCMERLRPLGITADEALSIRNLLDGEIEKESVFLDSEIKTLQEKIQPLQTKLDRLTHGYLDELIDEETYLRAKEELVLQKNALKREKERLHKSRSSFWIEPAREVINALESIGNTGLEASLPELARQVQKIGTNPQISGKKVTFSFSEPYDSIPKLLASVQIQPSHFAPSRSDDKSHSSMWCRGQDSNLQALRHQILSLARLPISPPRPI